MKFPLTYFQLPYFDTLVELLENESISFEIAKYLAPSKIVIKSYHGTTTELILDEKYKQNVSVLKLAEVLAEREGTDCFRIQILHKGKFLSWGTLLCDVIQEGDKLYWCRC